MAQLCRALPVCVSFLDVKDRGGCFYLFSRLSVPRSVYKSRSQNLEGAPAIKTIYVNLLVAVMTAKSAHLDLSVETEESCVDGSQTGGQ